MVVNKAKLLEQGHKLLKEDSKSSRQKRNWEGNSHFRGQNSRSNKKQSTIQFHNRNQQSESVQCWRYGGVGVNTTREIVGGYLVLS